MIVPDIATVLGPVFVRRRVQVLNGTQLELSKAWMIAADLHHDYAGLEFSFGRTFEKLVDLFLNLVTDLLLSTFLAYSARDIFNFNEVGLYLRSG